MSLHAEQVLKRAIVVVGSPRSGTTSASLILGAHPEVALIGEPRLTWQWGNEQRSDLLHRHDATPRIRDYIRHSFAERARAAGASRIVEKTPSNSIRMDFVDAVLPDCLFVHTIRDPRDAVLSIMDYWTRFASGLPGLQLRQRLVEFDWRRTPQYARELLRRTLPGSLTGAVGRPVWGPRLPAIGALSAELDICAIACLQWRACVESACQFGRRLPPNRYFEFRVEEFSETVLDALIDFSGLTRDAAVLEEYGMRMKKMSPRKRQRDADADTLRRILEWTEPTMRWLGYDPADA